MAVITVPGFKCNRCGWTWAPRRKKAPKVCPKCKRTDYDQEPANGREAQEQR